MTPFDISRVTHFPSVTHFQRQKCVTKGIYTVFDRSCSFFAHFNFIAHTLVIFKFSLSNFSLISCIQIYIRTILFVSFLSINFIFICIHIKGSNENFKMTFKNDRNKIGFNYTVNCLSVSNTLSNDYATFKNKICIML